MNNVVFVLHFFVVDSCVFGKTTGSVFPRPSLGPVRRDNRHVSGHEDSTERND